MTRHQTGISSCICGELRHHTGMHTAKRGWRARRQSLEPLPAGWTDKVEPLCRLMPAGTLTSDGLPQRVGRESFCGARNGLTCTAQRSTAGEGVGWANLDGRCARQAGQSRLVGTCLLWVKQGEKVESKTHPKRGHYSAYAPCLELYTWLTNSPSILSQKPAK